MGKARRLQSRCSGHILFNRCLRKWHGRFRTSIYQGIRSKKGGDGVDFELSPFDAVAAFFRSALATASNRRRRRHFRSALALKTALADIAVSYCPFAITARLIVLELFKRAALD
jgi:hypothetical protein